MLVTLGEIPNAIVEDKSGQGPPNLQDSRWKEAGTVSKLMVYPVKSFCGVRGQEAIVEKHGLRMGDMQDRQFMVVQMSKNGNSSDAIMITGRQHAKLVLITATVVEKVLELAAPGMDPIRATIPDTEDNVIRTKVFDSNCSGIDMGPEVGGWIGRFLDKSHLDFRLLCHPYSKQSSRDRQDPRNGLIPMAKPDDVPLFADGFGFLLVNEDSVAHVKSKFKNSNLDVDDRRFRGNIIIKNSSGPYCEDSWIYVKIKDTIFRNTVPCSRCIFTTVDPDQGVKDSQMEPWKTMKSFRKTTDPRTAKQYEGKTFMGINLGVDETGGTISEGDAVFVIENSSPDPSGSIPWASTSLLKSAMILAGVGCVLWLTMGRYVQRK